MTFNYKVWVVLIILYVTLIRSLSGQVIEKRIIANSGDTYNIEGVQLDWTIGELVTDYYRSNEMVIESGFHNSKKEVSTAVIDELGFDLYDVYPNPASDIVFINSASKREIHYSIHNAFGTLIYKGDFLRQEKIDVSTFERGLYYLQLFDGIKDRRKFVKM